MVMTREDHGRQLTVEIQNCIQEYMLAAGSDFQPDLDHYNVDINDITCLIRTNPDLFIRDIIKSVAEHKVFKCSTCEQLQYICNT